MAKVAECASEIYVRRAKEKGRENLIPDGPVYGPDDVENILEAVWSAREPMDVITELKGIPKANLLERGGDKTVKGKKEFFIVDFRSLGGRVETWEADMCNFALENYRANLRSRNNAERWLIVSNAPSVWASTAQEAIEKFLAENDPVVQAAINRYGRPGGRGRAACASRKRGFTPPSGRDGRP